MMGCEADINLWFAIGIIVGAVVTIGAKVIVDRNRPATKKV